jgi:ABC-type bacteriocin/lantibiotic exporter with double-glycine peptidase domain
MNDIKQKVLYQQLRFARISSYCSLIVACLSTLIGFVGVGLVLHGNITIGALTSISSILATNELKKIAGEANLRIDRLLQEGQKNEE